MENGGRIAAAALATVVVGCGSTVALIRQRSDRVRSASSSPLLLVSSSTEEDAKAPSSRCPPEQARPETVNDMIPHSSIDVALAPVVLEVCDLPHTNPSVVAICRRDTQCSSKRLSRYQIAPPPIPAVPLCSIQLSLLVQTLTAGAGFRVG